MSDKWNEIYAQAELSTPAEPAWVLNQHAHYLPLSGHALDLACGLGGNARFLARCGLNTEAWDQAEQAISLLDKWRNLQGLHNLQPRVVDVLRTPLPADRFDVIVVSRYLQHTLLDSLANALKPGGLLYYQTFLAPIHANAPRNPLFYLYSGELQQAWSKQLSCEVYGEGWLPESHRHAQRMAWFVGRKA